MRNRIPPALKHGAYSATAVLPGESQAAFEKLHRDLIAELNPSGVLEDDIVADMARLVWRKQNLGTLRIAERAQNRLVGILETSIHEYYDDLLLASVLEPIQSEEQKREEIQSCRGPGPERAWRHLTNWSNLVKPPRLVV